MTSTSDDEGWEVSEPLEWPFDPKDIASLLNAALRAWDHAIELHAGEPAAGSAMHSDLVIGRRRNLSPRVTEQTRLAVFLLTASVAQMTRSVSALFDTAVSYRLTFGHIPAFRSILEGAGQVKWLLAHDDTLATAGHQEVLSEEETAWRCERRTARAILTVVASWQQFRQDGKLQSEPEMERDANSALAEMLVVARELEEPVMSTKREKWSLCGQGRPTLTEFAKLGWALGWWPESPSGHIYGWVSAVSHGNLYPVGGSLVRAVSNGQRVLAIRPDPGETLAGGLAAARVFIRVVDLVFAYMDWDNGELAELWPIIAAADEVIRDL